MNKLLIYLILLFSPFFTKGENNTFYFIQLTDPQFGMIEENNSFSAETELMEKAVIAINKLNPKFVVITGDLVHNGKDKRQVQEFKRIANLINKTIPLYIIPGNHDVGQDASDASVNNYINEYGYDCFSFYLNNVCFIGINTQIIWAKQSKREMSQFIWMEKILSNSQKCNHRIIFGHHPFFVNTADEPDTYQNIPLEKRNEYLTLFKNYNVKNIFSGHLHYNLKRQLGDLELITTSALGKQLGKDNSGIRIVKVYHNKIISEYYDLDNIPSEITF